MRKTVLQSAALSLAVLLACMAGVLTAKQGVAQAMATLVGAGDIAGRKYTEDGATARLLGTILGTVFTLGDNVYTYGTAAEFRNCYDPTWGKYKDRTKPTAGNHDYYTAGAEPYFDYFGRRAGRPTQGYYAYDRGAWHIVALNSNCKKVGGCGRRSTQGRWLRRNLANHRTKCTLACLHHPLYSTGNGTPTTNVKPFWRILYNQNADVVLSGHAHRYERFAPITPGGRVNKESGIRQFIVGTGGNSGGDETNFDQAPACGSLS